MLMHTGFIVVIAVACSVYGGFSNLVKIGEMEGALKVPKIFNLFYDETPVDIQSTISALSDDDTAGAVDSLDDENIDPIWWSSNYNPFSMDDEGECNIWERNPNCPQFRQSTKELMDWHPTTAREAAIFYGSLAAEAALDIAEEECKHDDDSILLYGVTAFAIISEETRKNPALIECVTRVVYDLVTEPRFIDIYVSPDVSLCPPNMREVNLLMESFTQCSVRLRWLIDFEKIGENNSHL